MMDEYSKLTGSNNFGCITGKPLCVGGYCGRSDATARGGMYALREAARELGIDLSRATIAIQGYGNAGSYAHSLAKELFGKQGCRGERLQGGSIQSGRNRAGGGIKRQGGDLYRGQHTRCQEDKQ